MHKIGLSLLTLALVPLAWAALNVEVKPGYEFTAGETVTRTKLNALGSPVVDVSGTVDGSTVSLGAMSDEHVNTNAIDNVTLGGGYLWEGSTTPLFVRYDDWSLGVVSNKLAIKTNGVQSVHIAAGAVGTNELSTTWLTNQINGVSVSIWDKVLIANQSSGYRHEAVDINWLFAGGLNFWLTNNTPVTPADADRLFIMDDSITGAAAPITVAGLRTAIGAAPEWSTNGLAIANGELVNAPHELGRAPYRVEAWLECTTAEYGYAVGDKVKPGLYHYESGGGTSQHQWSIGGNTTNVFLAHYDVSTPRLASRTNAYAFSINASNWTISMDAW